MFSLQQSNELVFQSPCISIQRRQRIRQERNPDDFSDPTTTTSKKNQSTRKRYRQLTMMPAGARALSKKEESYNNIGADDQKVEDQDGGFMEMKKLMHREIEKQRRQDMAKLCSSLRSLLPLEFIKGKRSIPDHMERAVKYIRHMQQNIKYLSLKRNELMKNKLNTSVFSDEKNNIVIERSLNHGLPNANKVTVSSCPGGVEILINSGYNTEYQPEFMLSRLLQVLYQNGFSVQSYSSTKVNERFFLTILSEVSNMTSIHVSLLQQHLSDIVRA